MLVSGRTFSVLVQKDKDHKSGDVVYLYCKQPLTFSLVFSFRCFTLFATNNLIRSKREKMSIKSV